MLVAHIIDRDAATRLAARRVLEPAEFTVTEMEDAGPGPVSCPDLVIADLAVVSLPALRRRYPAARILPLAAEAAMLAGGLRKPFTPSELLAAVRLCLARPRATTGPRRRLP